MIPGVPYDAEIEYLESTGTQYIDTGVSMAGITTWIANIKVASMPYTTRENPFFSIWTSAYNYWNVFFRDGKLDLYHGGHFYYQDAVQNGVPYDVIVGYDTNGDYGYRGYRFIGLNGNEPAKTNVGTQFANPTTLKLFVRGDLNTGNFGKCRIYYVTVKDGVNKILDFIPVRIGQTGYMYDRVTKRLFGNNGTGSFVLGPDVAKPVMGLWGMLGGLSPARYVRSGLVSMWDGIDNVGLGVHDDKATTWVDIVGGMNLSKRGNGTIKVKPLCMSFDGTYCFYASKSLGSICTMEIVVDAKTQIGSADPVLVQLNGTSEYKAYVNTNQLTLGISNVGSMGQRFGYINTGVKNVSWVFEKSPQLGYLFGTQTGTWNQNRPQTATSIGVGAANSSMFRPGVGDIYCVRLYNRALSAAEIAHNYAIDKARFNLA